MPIYAGTGLRLPSQFDRPECARTRANWRSVRFTLRRFARPAVTPDSCVRAPHGRLRTPARRNLAQDTADRTR